MEKKTYSARWKIAEILSGGEDGSAKDGGKHSGLHLDSGLRVEKISTRKN
jgi:hypothetical protein